MNDVPAATRLAFFPRALVGTAALPASDAPLKWMAGQVASGAMPSLRVQTFDFDAVRRAHSLIESDRAVGRLVVMVSTRTSASATKGNNILATSLESCAEQS